MLALRDTTKRVRVIDSHTGGEPTRVVVSGAPELGHGTLSERLERFRTEYDDFRSAVINEPRGSDALVGAVLCDPLDDTCVTGVLCFNNVAYLGMCGHGTIGVVATLAYLGRIQTGTHRIETPVGVVEAHLYDNGEIEIANVPRYMHRAGVPVLVPGVGSVTGDVAWGGNWFFLVQNHEQQLTLDNLEALTDYTSRIRDALAHEGITGADGHEIDHVELFGPSE